jgi:hypothetical protein
VARVGMLVFFSDLGRKTFNFSLLSMMLAVDLSYIAYSLIKNEESFVK